MGFNKRKMEDQRRDAAEKEAANRRATEAQVLEDAERLIVAWNERQAKRMPMLFSPTIGAAITAGYWFLWVRCPACRTINAIDLRTLDRHPDAAVSSLIPALSCRSCRPNAQAILEAAEQAGGEDGIVGYLVVQAHANPAAFMSLLGKVLPMTIADTGQNEETKIVVTSHVVWPKDKDGNIIKPSWWVDDESCAISSAKLGIG